MYKKLFCIALLLMGLLAVCPNVPAQTTKINVNQLPSGSGTGSANNAWVRLGPIITPLGNSTDQGIVQEFNPFFPPTPVVLTTAVPAGVKVKGSWYTEGNAVLQLTYSESYDWKTWINDANATIGSTGGYGYAHSWAGVIGSTSYVIAAKINESTLIATQLDIWSGADAEHMSLLKSAIVTTGGSTWKQHNLANSAFWHDLDGNYYLLYEAQTTGGDWSIGLATCTAPSGSMTCTDYGSNPVISNGTGTISDPKSIKQISASSYITWLHGTNIGASGNLPSYGFFATSSGAHPPTTWSINSTPVLYPSTYTGVNNTNAQLADLGTLTDNGRCYLTDEQYANGGPSLSGSYIEAWVANQPCESFAANTTQSVSEPSATQDLPELVVGQGTGRQLPPGCQIGLYGSIHSTGACFEHYNTSVVEQTFIGDNLYTNLTTGARAQINNTYGGGGLYCNGGATVGNSGCGLLLWTPGGTELLPFAVAIDGGGNSYALMPNIVVGTHSEQSNANTWSGTCTLGTSCVITFGASYNQVPACTATDTSNADAVKAAATASVLTITGNGTDVIAWQCVGNPN